jgi:hypothetical protein
MSQSGGSPETSRAGEPAFTTVAIVYSLPEATVLTSLLRGRGILAYAGTQATLATNPNWMVALGGIQIQVASVTLEEAVDLLHASDAGWSPPPRSYAAHWLLNGMIAIALALFCGAAPPPRVRGTYLWAPIGGRMPEQD